MKSYNNLFEKFISDDNIRLAVNNAARGQKARRTKEELLRIRDNIDEYLPRIRKYASNFYNMKHNPVQMRDGITGKVRIIVVPKPIEQIVHHMIVNVLQPIFFHGMYDHSYASIPGRGGLKGKKYLEKQIRKGGRRIKYVLKLDIKQYFASIPHDKLKARLTRIIRDKRFLHVLFVLIDVIPKGLPLGFYTSQWLANWYLQPLDHYIKEELHIKIYVRYLDDEVLMAQSKKVLHKARKEIEAFLERELGLRLKGNWQVYRFNTGGRKYRDIDFMGYRFYRDRTTLRKSILHRLKRCAKRIGKAEKPSIFQIRRFLSYMGWVSHTDTYGAFKKYVTPYVNIRRCKQRISNYDRRKIA